MDLYENYLKEIRGYSLLTQAQESELAEQIQRGNQVALDRLIKANLRLVVSVAKKFTMSYKFSVMDLIQEGNLGLMAAAQKFSSSFNTKFSTYAYTWIFQYMLRFVHNKTSIIELPHRKEEILRTAKNGKVSFMQKYGFEPSVEELAEYLGVSEFELRDVLSYSYSFTSIDVECSDDNGETIGDLLPDMTYNPESNFLIDEEKKSVESMLCSLPEKERIVINERFNFDCNQHVPTLRELSSSLGVSAETVRQMELRALKRLRKSFVA